MTVLSYEDEVTRRALAGAHKQCFGFVGFAAISRIGDVWGAVAAAGLKVSNARSVDVSMEDATSLFGSYDWYVGNGARTSRRPLPFVHRALSA